MAFDEAKFRSSAKAAGYSDAEIDAELKGAAPAGSAPPTPSMDDTFAEKEKALRLEYDKKVKQATTSEVSIGDRTFEIPSFFTSPAGIVTAVGAGIGLGSTLYGAGSVAPKVYQSIKDRWMTKTPEIDRTIDIPLEATPSRTPNVSPTPLQQTSLTPQEVQTRADVLKAAQPVAPTAPPAPQAAAPQPPQAAPEASKPFVPPTPMTPEELAASFRGEAPKAPIATPLSAAPVDAPAPLPSAKPNSPVTSIVADTLKELMQEPVVDMAPKPVAPPQELRTGTGKPAFAGMGPEAALNKKGDPKFKTDYASVADVPSGYAFVPGAQYIDTPRQNIGQAEYTKAYTARPFPISNELAIQESSDINRLLGRATRAEAKAAGLPPAEITPGITKKTSAGTKPVRVAGTVGALMAISDLAKADTSDQRAMAATNLLEAILPPGFMMGNAGEGSTLTPQQRQYQQNAMLLGSPYAQSDFAKRKRQEEEYIRKIGAGRGIAPPSAYQR